MAELTVEQQKALALARARAAAAAAGGASSAQAATAAPEGSTTPPRALARAGGHTAFNAGMAQEVIKGAMGVKSLFTELSDEDKAVLSEIKAENEADPEWVKRGLGGVVANVVNTVLPAGKAAQVALKGAKALPTALQWLAPMATAAAVSGGQSAVLTPSEGGSGFERAADKGTAALKDAATGAALAGTGQVLKKAVTGMFSVKPEAEMLFKKGINPTLQQGADGWMGRFVGGLTSGAVPVKQRQADEVADALLDRVTQGNVAMPKATGREYFDAAKNYVSGLYDQVMAGKRLPISPTTRGEVAAAASQLNKTGQFQDEAQKASRIVANVMGDAPRNINVNSQTLRDNYLTPLSKAAYADGIPEELKRRILAAREVLIDKARTQRLTADEQELLRQADVLNFDVQRLREATTGPGGVREGINLKKLVDAYGRNKMTGNTTGDDLIFPADRVLGTAPNQDMSRSGLVAAGRVAGGATAGTLASVLAGVPGLVGVGGLYGLSLAGQTRGGAKFLMGQNDWQKRLAEYLRQAAPYAAGAGETLTGD